MEPPRAASGTLLVQTLGVLWRPTTVDLRYVPVSVSSEADGTEELSLLAVLVIFRGRLQRYELLNSGLPRDAAVYPLTTPNRGMSARFFRLSAAAEARFSFGIEWRRTVVPPTDGSAPEGGTPAMRLLFRATSASEYARWKQLLGAALAMPVARISASSEGYEAFQTSLGVPVAPSNTFPAPSGALLDLARRTSHVWKGESSKATTADKASNPRERSSMATQGELSKRHGAYSVNDDASVPQHRGKYECAHGTSRADDDANGCNPALVSPPPIQLDADPPFPRDPAVHPIDCLAAIDPGRTRLKHAHSHGSVQLPFNSFRLHVNATFAVSARQVAPRERVYWEASSASQLVDIAHPRLGDAINRRLEDTNGDTTSPCQETSQANETCALLDHATASVGVNVQAIVRHFETFSWQPDIPGSGRRLSQSSTRTKPQWRRAQSMPPSLDTLPFNERDGFSWRVTPASRLRQQRYQSIREVNREIERRVRALMNDLAPPNDVEARYLPVLLPELTIQPWNVPPSTRSAFEEFCCH